MPVNSFKFEQYYGRARAKPRDKKKEVEGDNSTKNEEERSFIKRFSGERVKIELVNGHILGGILEQNPYNKYDVILQTGSQGNILIPKRSVLLIQIDEEGKD